MGARARNAAAALALCALTAATGGCAASRAAKAPREPLPPRTVTPPRPTPPPEPAAPAPAPKPTTLVVPSPEDAEATASGPETLVEASRRERERRRSARPPVAVINDKNLAEYAEGETLTVAEPGGPAAGADGEELEAPTADGKDETWWRDRGLGIRRRWKEATEAVTRLEGEAASLRADFYAADDPYLRDSRIKPQWDRVLAELDAARRDAERGPEELADYYEQGRRAGALPGWLREGVELEPTPVSPEPEAAEPREPPVAGEAPPGP